MKFIKKIILLKIIFVTMFLILPSFVQASKDKAHIDLTFKIGDNMYYSNGKKIVIDIEPTIESGRTLVPFRVIFEELEYDINWIDSEKKIVCTKDDTKLELVIDNYRAYVDGQPQDLDVAPKIVNGRTIVPLRFVSEASGSRVDWEHETKSIKILKLKPSSKLEVSPDDKTGLFYRETSNSYYVCDSYGKNPYYFGEYSILKWITNDKIYAEKKVGKTIEYSILNLNGEKTSEINGPMYFVGTTKDDKIFVTDGKLLYYEKGDVFQEIGILPYKSVYLYAETIEGPYISYRSSGGIYLVQGHENSVKIGDEKLVVGKDGEVVHNNRYKYGLFTSHNIQKIAYLQKDKGVLWLNILDKDDLKNPIKTILNYNLPPDTKIQDVSAQWTSNNKIVIDSKSLRWSISIDDWLEIDILNKENSRFDFSNTVIWMKGKDSQKLYFSNGSNSNTLNLYDKKVVKWYPFKDSILISIFDKETYMTNLMLYKGGNLSKLVDDFTVVNTLEFNDNLLINGSDKTQKYDNLYRFDGTELYKMSENFYTGKYAVINDILVINKYDNKRNYKLIAFDRKSWNENEINSGFIVNDLIVGTNLYMLGSLEVGFEKLIARFDGQSTLSNSFKFLNSDVGNAKIENYGECNGELYCNYGNYFHKVSENNPMTVDLLSPNSNPSFEKSSDSLYVVGSKTMHTFNGKIYLNIDKIGMQEGEKYEIKKEDDIGWTEGSFINSVVEFDGINFNRIISNFKVDEFKYDGYLIHILGENKLTKDDMLYLYDQDINISNFNPSPANDVFKTSNSIRVEDMTFIEAEDYFRITNSKRKLIILYEDTFIKNLLTDSELKFWDETKGVLVLAAIEEDTKDNKVYIYNNNLKTVLGNFSINIWEKMDDIIFVGGENLDTQKEELYKFNGIHKTNILENFQCKSVIGIKNGYYIIHGIDTNADSKMYKEDITYIYNESSNVLKLLLYKTEVLDMYHFDY